MSAISGFNGITLTRAERPNFYQAELPSVYFKSTAEKVGRFFLEFFACIAGGIIFYIIIRCWVLPSATLPPAAPWVATKCVSSLAAIKQQIAIARKEFLDQWTDPKNPHLKLFTPYSYQVTTPDGAKLDVFVLKHRKSDENTPTFLTAQPNGASFTQEHALLDEYCEQPDEPRNFVFFDYRAVGNSKEGGLIRGSFSSTDDLVVDGGSVLQLIRDKGIGLLGTRPEQIHFYGRSMGGAVMTCVKAMEPEIYTGTLLNDRSFSRLALVPQHLPIPKPLGYIARGILSLSTFDLNPAEALKKIQGRCILLSHPDDGVIRGSAKISATSSLRQFDTKLSAGVLQGNPLPKVLPKEGARVCMSEPTYRGKYSEADPHNRSFSCFQGMRELLRREVLGLPPIREGIKTPAPPLPSNISAKAKQMLEGHDAPATRHSNRTSQEIRDWEATCDAVSR